MLLRYRAGGRTKRMTAPKPWLLLSIAQIALVAACMAASRAHADDKAFLIALTATSALDRTGLKGALFAAVSEKLNQIPTGPLREERLKELQADAKAVADLIDGVRDEGKFYELLKNEAATR